MLEKHVPCDDWGAREVAHALRALAVPEGALQSELKLNFVPQYLDLSAQRLLRAVCSSAPGVMPLRISQVLTLLDLFRGDEGGLPAQRRFFAAEVKGDAGMSEEQVRTSAAAAAAASSPPADEICAWDLSRANRFELRFFRLGHERLVKTLAVLGLQLAALSAHSAHRLRGEGHARLPASLLMDSTRPFCLVLLRGATRMPLTHRDLRRLTSDLERCFEGGPVFNYEAVLLRAFDACKAILARRLTGIVPDVAARLAEVKLVRNVSSGDEAMVPFEVAFETNMAWRAVSWPDPFSLSERHLREMMRRFGVRSIGRFLRDFYVKSFSVLCHEALHCVQGAAAQRDPDPFGWSAEHDAAFAGESLLWELAHYPPLSDVFYPGFLFEILSHDVRVALRMKHSWPQEVRQAYNRWRDSCGLFAPPVEISRDAGLSFEFTYVVGVESMHEEPLEFQAQLELIFRSRTGNVTAVPLRVPPHIQTHSGRLEKLARPLEPAFWLDLVEHEQTL